MEQENKQGYFWNMVGSICYSASSFVLLIAVTRNVGADGAGIFSLAFSIAQLMLAIGRYGMRPFQATDVRNIYSFSDYFTSRVMTCTAMMAITIIYSICYGFTGRKLLIVFFVCFLKMSDALEDVYHGMLQREFHLADAGKLQASRNTLSVLIFVFTIYITKDILITCVISSVLSALFCILMNEHTTRKIFQKKLLFSKHLFYLFRDCVWLFAGAFLSLYIYNIPKYAINRYLSDEFQTYYGIMFMISFVISVFSEMIFRPLLTQIAVLWDKQDIKKLVSLTLRLLIMILLAGTVGTLVFAKPGLFVLSKIYNVSLDQFMVEFRFLVIGGTLSAAVYMLYNILSALRKQKWIFCGYFLVALLTNAFSYQLTKNFGMKGATISYMFSQFLLLTLFVLIFIVSILKKKNNKGISL